MSPMKPVAAPDAPATPEELQEAEALVRDLESDAPALEASIFLRDLASLHAPATLSKADHEALIQSALEQLHREQAATPPLRLARRVGYALVPSLAAAAAVMFTIRGQDTASRPTLSESESAMATAPAAAPSMPPTADEEAAPPTALGGMKRPSRKAADGRGMALGTGSGGHAGAGAATATPSLKGNMPQAPEADSRYARAPNGTAKDEEAQAEPSIAERKREPAVAGARSENAAAGAVAAPQALAPPAAPAAEAKATARGDDFSIAPNGAARPNAALRAAPAAAPAAAPTCAQRCTALATQKAQTDAFCTQSSEACTRQRQWLSDQQARLLKDCGSCPKP